VRIFICLFAFLRTALVRRLGKQHGRTAERCKIAELSVHQRLMAAAPVAAPAPATPSRDRTGWIAGGSGTALAVQGPVTLRSGRIACGHPD